ncbi:MAG: hypothetical protein HUU57_14885 [Bdellovibrio sp.]|nr:hypothetical protein [Bdellovibrio sp.]
MRTEAQIARTKKTLRAPVKRAAVKSSGIAKKAKTAGKTAKTGKRGIKATAKMAAPKVTSKKAETTSASYRGKMTKTISANKRRASRRELPEDHIEEPPRSGMTEQPKMRLSRKGPSKRGTNQLRERQRRQSLPENHVNPSVRSR